jgi:hypothetical protein
MLSASECFHRATQLTEKADKASSDADRKVLRNTAMHWITLGEGARIIEARTLPFPKPQEGREVASAG